MADKELEKVATLEGQVTDLEAQIADLTKKLETAADGNEILKQLTDMTKLLEESTAALEKANAERDLAVAISKLSPEERVHLESLQKADAEDKKDGGDDEDAEGEGSGGKRVKKFLGMSPEARKAEIEKIAKADETVVLDGETIKKSAVGEATFNVLKKQADRQAKIEKDLVVERDARLMATFSKRADEAYGHVPGSTEERAKMLKHLDSLTDEPLKKAFLAVFEQSEKLAKAAFEPLGKGPDGKPIQKSQTVSKDGKVIAKAVQDFETKVSEIAARDKIGKSAAMAKARKEHADLFKAYQEADTQTA